MNASTAFPATDRAAPAAPPIGFHDPAAAWTGPRQRVVLEAFAEGCTVPDACRRVGLTPASLYAFANSCDGGQFAVGWEAAILRSRRAIQDLALSRVIDGFEERTLRADGTLVVRHRYDNRLMLRMLERLDRHAESHGPQSLAGARLRAEDFGEFLDSISDDPVANHAAIVESARPGALPGWAGRHAPTVFEAAADSEEGEGWDDPEADPPARFTLHLVHDADRTLVDVVVSNPPEPITQAQAEAQVYAQVRDQSADALPPTLAALRAAHGRTGRLPTAWRRLWHRGYADMTEFGIEDLDPAPAAQGSA
jgi:hypothetical protein